MGPSDKRQQPVSVNALDHSAIVADPCSGERQRAISGNALDHSAIGADHSVVRDS